MFENLYLAVAINDVMFLLLPLVGCVALAYAVFNLVKDLRRTEHHKLMERLEGKGGGADDIAVHSLLRKHAGDKASNPLDAMVRKLSVVGRLQRVLDQANVPWSASHTLVNLFGLAILALVGCLLLGKNPLLGVGIGAAVVLLPLFYFAKRRSRRLNKFIMQLPDVFELMGQALAAGHSLASSIHLISEQMPDPASTEFGRVFHEQNLGLKIEDALINMGNRVDMLDVRFFVTAVLISRSTGGDLREVLDKIGSVIRQRIELFGQVKALTAEGRMSGYVLFALPIVVFAGAMCLNPEYAGVLLTDPKGKMMLFVAGGMQLMGLAMIRYIVNIKV